MPEYRTSQCAGEGHLAAVRSDEPLGLKYVGKSHKPSKFVVFTAHPALKPLP